MPKGVPDKVRMGSHAPMIKGLGTYVWYLDGWPEIRYICIGAKDPYPRRRARKYNNVKRVAGKRTKRRGGVGGFRFRVVGLERKGPYVTGIVCKAEHGSMRQSVVLKWEDRAALEDRLRREGLWGN